MKKFRIPESFYLHGQKIKVGFSKDLVMKSDAIGMSKLRANQILIQDSTAVHKLAPQQQEEVFFHELVHFILDHMGEEELCRNEDFTDSFAHLLHQAMTTMEYTKKGKKNG